MLQPIRSAERVKRAASSLSDSPAHRAREGCAVRGQPIAQRWPYRAAGGEPAHRTSSARLQREVTARGMHIATKPGIVRRMGTLRQGATCGRYGRDRPVLEPPTSLTEAYEAMGVLRSIMEIPGYGREHPNGSAG